MSARPRRSIVARLVAAAALAGTLTLPTAGPAAASGLPVLDNCSVANELGPGSAGDEVRCLQTALILSGFSISYSGAYDPSTVGAVARFQSRHSLPVTGLAGVATLATLGVSSPAGVIVAPLTVQPFAAAVAAGSPAVGGIGIPLCLADATVSPGERGLSVVCVQRRLAELGLYGGPISGTYDAGTQAAVREFQRQNPPLSVDGTAGRQTLLRLVIWSGYTSGDGRSVGPDVFPAPMQPEPEWNLTAQGIPYFGNRKACTPEEAAVIAAEFAHDGADVATQQWAVYIASREAGCRFGAVLVDMRTRDDSHCTFQLNVLSGTFGPSGELGRRGWSAAATRESLRACADAASDLWVRCGRGPWIKPYFCAQPWAGAPNGQPPSIVPAVPADPVVPPPPPTTVPSPPATVPPPPATAPPAAAVPGEEATAAS